MRVDDVPTKSVNKPPDTKGFGTIFRFDTYGAAAAVGSGVGVVGWEDSSVVIDCFNGGEATIVWEVSDSVEPGVPIFSVCLASVSTGVVGGTPRDCCEGGNIERPGGSPLSGDRWRGVICLSATTAGCCGDVDIQSPGGENDADFVCSLCGDGGTGGITGDMAGLLLGESKSMGDRLLSRRDDTLLSCVLGRELAAVSTSFTPIVPALSVATGGGSANAKKVVLWTYMQVLFAHSRICMNAKRILDCLRKAVKNLD